MKRKAVGLSISALLAVFGTFVLVAYVQSAHDRAAADERLVDVLVVREAVARGTAAAVLADSIETERVPAKVRAEGALASLREVEGKVVATDLVAGEQLIAAKFTARSSAGLAKPGLLQVTVSLAPERALGGNVRTGDTVGVVASFDALEADAGGAKAPSSTHLMLHKVSVTNVQSTETVSNPTAKPGEVQKATGTALFVTLALDAPSVERVVFAAENGSLWLVAEPSDAPEAGTKLVTRGNVF